MVSLVSRRLGFGWLFAIQLAHFPWSSGSLSGPKNVTLLAISDVVEEIIQPGNRMSERMARSLTVCINIEGVVRERNESGPDMYIFHGRSCE